MRCAFLTLQVGRACRGGCLPPTAVAGCAPLHPRPELTTKSRREKRQGNRIDRVRPSAPETECHWARAGFSRVHQTTLGNGYLGSRIDEERSEMRYLV